MPKPFPYPIAIATDICSVSRVRRLLGGKTGLAFIRRVLRPEERLENQERCDDALQQWRTVEKMKGLLAWKGEMISPGKGDKEDADGDIRVNKESQKIDEHTMAHLKREIQGGEKDAEESLKRVAEFMAGRFAAKEAIIKAHKRRIYFHDIVIRRPPEDKSGSTAPIAVVLPENGEWEDGQEVKISISHDTDYATAVCLAPTATSSKPSDAINAFKRLSYSTNLTVPVNNGEP
ncbi:hypothetical protein EG329_003137 [Mollisiaceae sp. DMI_Dod_QoI]|nr:hypothetical protein EG329_003137 [Helotiales sp. DMI_Dod_QoI]